MSTEGLDREIITTRDGASLWLRRSRKGGEKAVMLLHGGNTSGETFLFPEGGLVRYLATKGWDVWVLDWRGSPNVRPVAGTPFTVDDVAFEDIPRALEHVREKIGPDRHLAIVAHCLSGCALSMAIARGRLEESRVDAIALTTLGLFFESCWDGWIKAEDFILERILTEAPHCREIDPGSPDAWPGPFRAAFDGWPRAWLPTRGRLEDDPLQTLTFMFGQPYERAALHPDLRAGAGRLGQLFGPMDLRQYQHVGQMVRRGFAAPFDDPDVVDRPRLERAGPRATCSGYLDPGHFAGRRITLIGGAENRLWHRDSIDLMYEWLRSNAGGPGHRFAKQVIPGYGHQELFWGKTADADVYPHILKAIEVPRV